MNLLINAAHATPPGGTVTVRARAGPHPDSPGGAAARPAVVVEVDDTGTGVRAEHLPKLFDPVFTTKRGARATASGLSVCRTIMELHEGAIHIRDRPEGGARATLVFNAERT